MHLVCRFGIALVGCCVLLLGGCSHDGPASEEKKEQPHLAQKRWSASLHLSYSGSGSARQYEIEQGENLLFTLGITEDDLPIVEASFGGAIQTPHEFYLDVYLNRTAILKGVLSRGTLREEQWNQTSFIVLGETWKMVSGEKPQQKEWLWDGIYRTDGETIYFDATNKKGSHCTWILVTPAPRKSREW